MNKIKQTAVVALAMALSAGSALADDAYKTYFDVMGTISSHDRDRVVADGIAGGALRYGMIFNERWNFEGALGYLEQDADSSKGGTSDLEQWSVGANALAVFYRGKPFQPFLLAGLGGVNSDYANDDDTNLYYDLGAGAFASIFDDAARIRADVVYRFEDDDADNKDWIFNIGVNIPLGKKSEPVVMAAAPLDSDGDGVPDDLDQCPGTPAGAVVDANGCELDSDGDGVVDRLDKCPDTPPGLEVDADGCALPTVISLEGVNFRTNSAELLDGADEVLDVQAATLDDNVDVLIEVAGHTDSVGDAGYNEQLSQRRAEAVRDYLVSKGVAAERITAVGYGESEPIASNDTAEGRAENRRVELRIEED